MKVLGLSKTYPASHYLRGEATYFKTAFLDGSKIHTLRANAKQYFKDGDWVSVRQWVDKPYRSKRVEIGTAQIHLEPIVMIADSGFIDACRISGIGVAVDVVCRNDGLAEDAFFDWFFPSGAGTFRGDVLHFTKFRYLAPGDG